MSVARVESQAARWSLHSFSEHLPFSEQVRRIKAFHLERAERGRLDTWPAFYGIDIKSYNEDFQVIMEGVSVVDLVRSRTSPVVIDLMAPSGALASLFKRASREPHVLGLPFLSRKKTTYDFSASTAFGLAVSLEDRRDAIQKARDKELNIHQIAGDLMDISTFEAIVAALQGRKADLIMERASKGLEFFPINRRFYNTIIGRLWHLLSNQDGMLLLQVPPTRWLEDNNVGVNQIKRWVNQLREIDIEARYVPYESGSFKYGSIKITKTPAAPRDLPLFKAA